MSSPVKTAADLEQEQAREWNQYVAVEMVYVDGGLAAKPGDAIPASHVDRGVVADHQVAKPSTKTGREKLRAVGLDYPEPPEPPEENTPSGGGGRRSGAAAGGTPDDNQKG